MQGEAESVPVHIQLLHWGGVAALPPGTTPVCPSGMLKPDKISCAQQGATQKFW